MRTVISPNIINRPVDEGCAYLYGGSWKVYTWEQILERFKGYAKTNPKSDWLSLYNEGKDFSENGNSFPLKISYAINALIVKKMEAEQGFPKVKELLSCGKKEVGNANYFKA